MATGETNVAIEATATEATTTEATATNSVVLKRNSDDVGWKYGALVDPLNKEKVRCLFCGHTSSGGICRLKQHVAHVGTSVVKCTKQTEDAKTACKKSLEEATRKRKEKTARDLNLREEVNVSRVGEQEQDEVTCVGSQVASSEPHKLGPIDKWTRAIDPKATQAESLKQQKINKELWKQRTHEVQQYIARWMYIHAIPFNAVNNDEFMQMCEAIGQFGPGLQPPSQDHLRGVLLSEEYERTKSLVKEHDAEKIKNVSFPTSVRDPADVKPVPLARSLGEEKVQQRCARPNTTNPIRKAARQEQQ
ncbi:hAT transposon superfamily protein [Striga hermonthica]|uniref:HAT transposon superfamily protein n=1 Tax=Striga hermonthica TaxID=68872 RepID=A0A9N7NCY2_STRHE|nr:hAT transposon superfamily protein [Striga hermonthica]